MSGLSTEQERQIRELIAREQKITAIKLYREATGSSLKDAKDAVDAMELDIAINFPIPAQVGELDPILENQIKRLLAERKKIEAVKAYREAYNCGLKEAKDAVDAIEMQLRMGGYSSMPSAPAIREDDPFAEDTQRNRRFMALVLAIVVIVIGGIAFLFLAGNGF